ncbi:MAG: SH3 domain-containing protein, partial [Acidobacteriota bacterium]
MSLQEKYQTILELANQNGTSYELSEGDGVLHINGTAPSEEAKQQLWDEYNRIDPDYRAGD